MADEALDVVVQVIRDNSIDLALSAATIRPAFEARFAEALRPETIRYEESAAGGVPGIWCRPPDAPDDRAIIYLHGGGYVVGSAAAYSALAGELAGATGLNVFIADYRLAPEHPFPAATDDAFAAYRSILDAGIRPVAVVGDSAGGGLVMSLLLQVRAAGLRQADSSVLWSPWVNLACDSASYVANAAADPTLSVAGLIACAKRYADNQFAGQELLNPLQASLHNFSPMLIQVGTIEILLDDSTALAAHAASHGVRVQLEVYPGLPHVFHSFAAVLPTAARAFKNTAEFILSATLD